MPVPIRITIGPVQMRGELNDSPTARAIARKLPMIIPGNYWGDEIYGTVPVNHGQESTAVEIIDEPGTIGYWSVGKAFCLFWGPTPVSKGEEIRAASAINIIGRVTDGLDELIDTRPDPPHITVSLLEE